jgi:hypothetical protein
MIAVSGKKICRTQKLMLSLLSTLTREYREVWSLPLTLVGMVGQKNVSTASLASVRACEYKNDFNEHAVCELQIVLVDLIGRGAVPVPCLWCEVVGVYGVFVEDESMWPNVCVTCWPDVGEGVAKLEMLASHPPDI